MRLMQGVVGAVFVCAGVCMVGCIPPSTSCPTSVYLDHADNGTTRTVTVCGMVRIELIGNPGSTGYEWKVTSSNLPYLQFAGSTFTQGSGGMPGTPGFYDFQFSAIRAGTTTITIGLFAPGETTTPEETFSVTINVTGSSSGAPRTVELEDGESGQTRTTLVGGTVIAELLGGSTGTGPSWQLTSNGSPVLSVTGTAFNSSDPNDPAAPGFYIWRFTAAQAGQADLEFGLFDPSDTTTPLDTFTATIVVE
ncbi:MAG: protease inhibitor I42 family protein [Phycisphaerae bacterium]|nr:protease inhibitor I42 family protein [Phycisphaerae bacterium]